MVLAASGVVPAGMVAVSVPAGGLHLTLTGYDYNTFLPAPSFLIDRQEVTNAEFKAFVDAGGYQKRDYWTEPFSRDGKTLEWEEAMAIFRDRTGRPGPATWQGGSPPAGQEQHPVTGVSWFEAAAYAAYRGKRLPTIYHWSHAARPELGEAVTRTANFGGPGPLPATASRGLGAYGTVDMAGNVREWVWNDTGDGARYILGGAWNDPDYQFLYSDTRSPFDRSATNGFRCMKDGEIAAPAAFSASLPTPFRNYAGEKPVSDALYHIYAKQYEYRSDAARGAHRSHGRSLAALEARNRHDRRRLWRRTPADSPVPSEKGEAPLPGDPLLPWIERDQSSRAAKIVAPEAFGFDSVLMSGRAVAFPIYKYTFERRDPKVTSSWPVPTRAYATWVQQVVLDARRTLDYLESRGEIDRSRMGYFGSSWGARLAPITIALDSRLKMGILLNGGLGSAAPAPEADTFNFAPRVRVPILMLNGDQDFIFPLQTLQRPLFATLGTPAADKRHLTYPGGHEIATTMRNQVVQEMVGWLDKYLGRVQ